MIIGAFVGLFAGSLIFAVMDGFGFGTDIAGLAIISSLLFFIWLGSKTGNYIGDKIEDRKVTHSKPLGGKRVALQYINSSGNHRSAYVDSASAFRNHNKVKVNLWNSGGKMELAFDRIKNPEVLGLSKNPGNKDEVVSRDCPNCPNGNVRPWQGEMRCWNCGHVIQDHKTAQLLGHSAVPETENQYAVKVWYSNSRGEKKPVWLDPRYVQVNGSQVIVEFARQTGSITLNLEHIINPEVLGLDTEKAEEDEPPILHPKVPEIGDPSGPALRYRRRDGTPGVIYFVEDSVEIIGNRVNLSPKGRTERYAIALDQVLNPEVLEPAAPDVPEGELPPMLEPQEIYVGDVTGKELRYSRQDGSTGTIYFDPDTVEKVDNALYLRPRVVLSPQGRPERYSIALEKVHNPEVLFEVPELPPLLMPEPEPEPEPEPAQFQPGTRVVIDEVPLDSYEAVQVMRRLKPELGPFEILEVLKHEPATLLQGYGEERALSIGEELEATGCTVHLQTVDVPAS